MCWIPLEVRQLGVVSGSACCGGGGGAWCMLWSSVIEEI